MRSAVRVRMNWFWSVFTDLSVFLQMPFPVKPMSPKQTLIGVCLVVSMTIQAFEQMGAWFSFFGFQPWRVDLGICFAAPSKFLMMFGFVWIVVFNTFGTLNSVWKGCVAPLPAVFALWNTRVHISTPDGRDVVPDIETPIDQHFYIITALDIPDI